MPLVCCVERLAELTFKSRSVTVIIINVIVNAGADIVRLVNRAAVIGFITYY